MIYTNPGFIYLLVAILLCCIYYGIEMSNGALTNSTKSLLSSWSICSLIVASIILGIKHTEKNKPELVTPKYIMLMYGLSIGTITSSLIIISLAS